MAFEVVKKPIRNLADAARALIGRKSSELFLLRDAITALLADVEPPAGPKAKLVEHGIPRRQRVDLLIPVERALHDVVAGVEALGADPRLTQIVVDLQVVRANLADYVEEAGLA